MPVWKTSLLLLAFVLLISTSPLFPVGSQRLRVTSPSTPATKVISDVTRGINSPQVTAVTTTSDLKNGTNSHEVNSTNPPQATAVTTASLSSTSQLPGTVSAAVIGPTIDGTAVVSGSASVTLSTTQQNDLILVVARGVFVSGGVFLNVLVNDTAGLAYNRLSQTNQSVSGLGVASDTLIVYATSPNVLSSDTITASGTFGCCVDLFAFGVAGASSTTPFDNNGQVSVIKRVGGGVINNTVSGSGMDLVIGVAEAGPCCSFFPGSGYTRIQFGIVTDTEYRNVTSPFTNLDVSESWGARPGGQGQSALLALVIRGA